MGHSHVGPSSLAWQLPITQLPLLSLALLWALCSGCSLHKNFLFQAWLSPPATTGQHLVGWTSQLPSITEHHPALSSSHLTLGFSSWSPSNKGLSSLQRGGPSLSSSRLWCLPMFAGLWWHQRRLCHYPCMVSSSVSPSVFFSIIPGHSL